MEYLKIFETGANEIDVVGTFNTTAPKIVLKAGGLVIVPYDAIALLSEVKFRLDSESLGKDLRKLENVMQLNIIGFFLRKKSSALMRKDLVNRSDYWYTFRIPLMMIRWNGY